MKTPKDPSENHMDQKRYWRSIAHLEQDPETLEQHRREFPENASELPAGVDRRTFLGLMGASVALAGLTGCRRPEERIVPYVSKPEEITLGIPQQYATWMPLGTENYALLVESHEGRPTKIMGNAKYEPAGTATNVWASASILGLYDPDRSQEARERGKLSSIPGFVGAWTALRTPLAQNGGEGLALLIEPYASPTIHRLVSEFRAAYPKAIVSVWSPVSDENILKGVQIATGGALVPAYNFAKADVVLSLDADFLGTESRSVEHTRAFTARRRVRTPKDSMNRLYVVESTLSQTSGMADHRMTVLSRHVGAFAGALALELNTLGHSIAGVDAKALGTHPFDRKWVSALAKDLVSARGRSLVLAGRRQPPAVHALVAAINSALGNIGATVAYRSHAHAAHSDSASFSALCSAVQAGTVKTLAILGGNPALTAPVDSRFASLMDGVGTTVHLSPSADETASHATWHIPQSHYLESWGDAATLDGMLGVAQPLIAPLYSSRSTSEMLALLTTGVDAKGYDLVLQTWKGILPAIGFDAAFRAVLHDGVHGSASAAPPVQISSSAIASALASSPFPRDNASADNLELVFQLSPTIHDGRYVNNGWLQEFPDPVTKLTWDNALILSRATAAELGVKNKELVRVTVAGSDIGAAVWIMPGQAKYSATLALGWGQMKAGTVGSNRGFNAYRLRMSGAPDFMLGVVITKIGSEYKLACVQDHHGLDEEKLAAEGVKERVPQLLREGTLEEFRKEPGFVKERVEMPVLRSMWDEHKYDHGHQWGMSIDLTACTGCGACTVACQSENNIPIVGKDMVLNGREMHWIRIDRYFAGTPEDPEVMTQPVGCMQCEMAPCEQVCPVAATSHDAEGLNVMTYNRCIGTRYCSNNCPYKVRRFNFFNYTKDMPETVQMAMNPEVTVRFRGVMEKCTYCTQRISLARIAAKREGRAIKDGDIASACEQACPAQAIVFGDINDPASRVSAAKKSELDYAMLGELNIRPRTTYLAKLRNPNPELEQPAHKA